MPALRRRRRNEKRAHSEPDPHERQIIAALGALRDTSVREVMTPRVDVVALPVPVAAEDVARAVKESGHSRFPVYEGDVDHLLGVLFVKDLFRMSDLPTPETIARRLRRPLLVPEGRRVLEVLGEMRQTRHAFAVVVDEHGGIEGVLTVKDLVSELVGDLRDEFDPTEAEAITRVDPSRWLVDGQVSVDELCDRLGVALPEGEYVTVAGFLYDRFGRIPAEGDGLEHEGYQFKVAEMDRRRIAKIVVRAPSTTIAPDGNVNGK